MHDIQALRATFDEYDTSMDGVMQLQEAQNAFKHVVSNIGIDNFNCIFKLMDWNSNGVMDFDEFCHFVYVAEHCDFKSNASMVFYIHDTDHNGMMNMCEMTDMLLKLGC